MTQYWNGVAVPVSVFHKSRRGIRQSRALHFQSMVSSRGITTTRLAARFRVGRIVPGPARVIGEPVPLRYRRSCTRAAISSRLSGGPYLPCGPPLSALPADLASGDADSCAVQRRVRRGLPRMPLVSRNAPAAHRNMAVSVLGWALSCALRTWLFDLGHLGQSALHSVL